MKVVMAFVRIVAALLIGAFLTLVLVTAVWGRKADFSALPVGWIFFGWVFLLVTLGDVLMQKDYDKRRTDLEIKVTDLEDLRRSFLFVSSIETELTSMHDELTRQVMGYQELAASVPTISPDTPTQERFHIISAHQKRVEKSRALVQELRDEIEMKTGLARHFGYKPFEAKS